MTIKKLSVFVSILGILGFGLWQLKPKSTYQMVDFKIKNQLIKVEIADNASKRVLGLGNRASLPENSGMLFLFSSYDYPSIWMKNMHFSIDIIWLKDNEIVDVAEDIPAPSSKDLNLPTYSPEAKSNMVLELNAGMVKKLNLKIGDHLEIPTISPRSEL